MVLQRGSIDSSENFLEIPFPSGNYRYITETNMKNVCLE